MKISISSWHDGAMRLNGYGTYEGGKVIIPPELKWLWNDDLADRNGDPVTPADAKRYINAILYRYYTPYLLARREDVTGSDV